MTAPLYRCELCGRATYRGHADGCPPEAPALCDQLADLYIGHAPPVVVQCELPAGHDDEHLASFVMNGADDQVTWEGHDEGGDDLLDRPCTCGHDECGAC